MSLSKPKLQAFINRPEAQVNGSQVYQPILLSDSKGFLVQRSYPNNFLKFHCRSGVRTEASVDSLGAILNSYKIQGVNVLVYVWLGTNDITKKEGRYAVLRTRDNSAVDHIVQQFRRAISIVSDFPGFRIKFIETPPYSVTKYNAHRGHPESFIFNDQDIEICKQVSTLNSQIGEINRNYLQQNTLHFCQDILRRRKDKNRVRTSCKHAVYYNGIHPGKELATVWSVKLRNDINTNCFCFLEEDMLEIHVSEEDMASLF